MRATVLRLRAAINPRFPREWRQRMFEALRRRGKSCDTANRLAEAEALCVFGPRLWI